MKNIDSRHGQMRSRLNSSRPRFYSVVSEMNSSRGRCNGDARNCSSDNDLTRGVINFLAGFMALIVMFASAYAFVLLADSIMNAPRVD